MLASQHSVPPQESSHIDRDHSQSPIVTPSMHEAPIAAGGTHAGTAGSRPAIVVTGASEGIGLALADRFAAKTGYSVVMIARRSEPLQAAARTIAERHRITAIPLSLDITRSDAAAMIAATLASHGLHAEILINNAGVGLGGEFAGHDEAAIANLVDLNVRALTMLTRHFLTGMIARRSGGIINVGSLGGFAPGPYQAAYYASKAYVAALTRALSDETAGMGVHLCVVTPGPVETAFHARMGANESFYRKLMPAMTAEAVARATWRGWRLGFRVIQPGLFTPVLSILMRITPWLLLVPIVGWLLQKRYAGKR